MIVYVTNPRGSRLRRSAAEIESNLRLSANHSTKLKELIRSEAVVLRKSPCMVERILALVTRTYAIRPVVSRGKVSCKPNQRRFHLFGQGHGIWIQAALSVRRH